MVYIVIPVFNRLAYTKECIASLMEQKYNEFKVVIVDHGSTDGTSQYISENFPEVIIISGDESMWWSAATNLGVKYALETNATHILTLNNDLIVKDDYLINITEIAKENPDAMIGSLSVDISNHERVAYAGIRWNEAIAKFTKPIDLKQSFTEISASHELINSDLLPGRGTLIPVSFFHEVGLYNEENFPHYLGDHEFALRVRRKGYKLYISTKAIVYSHTDATGLNPFKKKISKMDYIRETFTSIRSPYKLSVKWQWAKKTRFPLVYFLIDTSRVFYSKVIKGK